MRPFMARRTRSMCPIGTPSNGEQGNWPAGRPGCTAIGLQWTGSAGCGYSASRSMGVSDFERGNLRSVTGLRRCLSRGVNSRTIWQRSGRVILPIGRRGGRETSHTEIRFTRRVRPPGPRQGPVTGQVHSSTSGGIRRRTRPGSYQRYGLIWSSDIMSDRVDSPSGRLRPVFFGM